MPELPEVEFAARILRDAAVGRTIASARVTHPALRRTLPARDIRRIIGRRIDAVERRGKHQFLRLDDGSVLHVHFRMAGDWDIGRTSDAPARHVRAILELSDGTRVSLIDSRALSVVRRHASDAAMPTLGPEATDSALDAAMLASRLTGRRGAIKTVLLDQRVIAGIGNIYASEALWLARIDPRRVASSLDRQRLTRLATAIRETMARALRQPARYYTDDDVRFTVYDREGERCPRDRARIRRIVQGARSTYFCPRCQR
jgi:formamidopyrimidine-DNA glycosylase